MTSKISVKPGYHSVEKYREDKIKRQEALIKAIAEAHVDAGTHGRGVMLVDEYGNVTRVNQKKVKVTLELIPAKSVKVKALTSAQAKTLHRLRGGK